MLFSKLFPKPVKNVSQDEKITSARLLYQGGFIRESTSGRYYMLPLAIRVHDKIKNIIKKEMDRAGGQEMNTPIFHPLTLWQETNRDKTAKFELTLLTDRRGAEFVPGGTAEEMFVDLIRKFKLSYKDLPLNLYQFSNKFRDELRARGGLLRVREFVMKDAYSFHENDKDFAIEYKKMGQTYTQIFKNLGIETVTVEADNGYIGGDYSHEYILESEAGESRFLRTEDGTYAAHEDVALFIKEKKNLDEAEKPMQVVKAVRGNTMEDGVKLHGLPLWQQTKDVMYVDEDGRFVLAVIRGDLDVNEIKLKKLAHVTDLRAATPEEIRDILHSEPGFISPVGIKEKMDKSAKLLIVVDDSMRTIKNAYGGNNAKHEDLFNINIDRDFTADKEGDIAMAQAGFESVNGHGKLIEGRGIEVGNIFQLGYHYTNLMKGATYMNAQGEEKPFYMGCYGIGLGRSLAAIIEKHHDERGIIWPMQVAPYHIHLIGLDLADESIKSKVSKVYTVLEDAGFEVLLDDRADVSPGAKFADADIIGIPVRLVVSKRAGDKIEFKLRKEKESTLKTLEEVITEVKKLL
ncbi:proline--tRNA ligase [Candidatus Woesebacteria bacterium]|nr:proline--tRNA ligase [Candidatus Woesebacteria bacterium]